MNKAINDLIKRIDIRMNSIKTLNGSYLVLNELFAIQKDIESVRKLNQHLEGIETIRRKKNDLKK